jgi:hypothetical protein
VGVKGRRPPLPFARVARVRHDLRSDHQQVAVGPREEQVADQVDGDCACGAARAAAGGAGVGRADAPEAVAPLQLPRDTRAPAALPHPSPQLQPMPPKW